jgi:hypothetical protein
MNHIATAESSMCYNRDISIMISPNIVSRSIIMIGKHFSLMGNQKTLPSVSHDKVTASDCVSTLILGKRLRQNCGGYKVPCTTHLLLAVYILYKCF